MLGQKEDICPSIKKSMTNQRNKQMNRRSSCSFLFQAISMEAQRGNCTGVMSAVESSKLLEEFLYNIFETKIDGFTFTYLNKLEIKSLLQWKRKSELCNYDIL